MATLPETFHADGIRSKCGLTITREIYRTDGIYIYLFFVNVPGALGLCGWQKFASQSSVRQSSI